MRYSDRPGMSGVERFMRHYFLIAKQVGDLTGLFLAHLDEKFAARSRRFGLPSIRRSPKKLNGFMLDRGKLAAPSDDFFSRSEEHTSELQSLMRISYAVFCLKK